MLHKDLFHLCPFYFHFIFHFYSIMTTLVTPTCQNPAELIIFKLFQNFLIRFVIQKRNAAFAFISFVVKWNVISNNNIQLFQLSFELLFLPTNKPRPNSQYGNGAPAMFTPWYYLKLRCKHCWKHHCRNGVVDNLGPRGFHLYLFPFDFPFNYIAN